MPRPPICFLSSEIDPGAPGGIGRLIASAMQSLHDSGWPAALLLDGSADALAEFDHHRAKMMPKTRVWRVEELLRDLPIRDDLPDWAFGIKPYHASYRAALAAERLAARTELSGIEIPDYLGLGSTLLKRRRLAFKESPRIPIWARLHGTSHLLAVADDRENPTPESRWIDRAERYGLAHSDGWVGPSSAVMKWYAESYGPKQATFVAAPAYHRIGARRIHAGLAVPAGGGTFLFYGRLQRLKGADLFIQAALRLLADGVAGRFMLVGGNTECSHRFSTYRAELEAMIPKRWRERFEFTGRINPETLPDRAARCVAAVVPSRIETFCLAVHELNWIGIPLILNDIAAFADYFHEGRDCLKFDGTPESLARAMRRVLDDGALRAQWNPAPPLEPGDLAAMYDGLIAKLTQEKKEPPPRPSAAAFGAPRVSIIVPYYEMHDYVEATLASVEAAQSRDWELILVNDGSRSEAAAAKFEALRNQHTGTDQYRFIEKPNGGLSSARNAGLEVARGRYILPLDADDLIEPDLLDRLAGALDANPDLDAVSCFSTYFVDGQEATKHHDYVIPYDLDPLLICYENRAGVACSMFRREVFGSRRYDESLFSYEDWDLWWSLAEAGCRAEVAPMVLFRYRHRPASMVNTVAMRRHAHLVSMLVDRHPRLVAEHAPELLKLYVDRLTALRANRGGAGLDPDAAGRMAEMERTIEDLRHSPSWQVLQFLRTRLGGLRRIKGWLKFMRPTFNVRIEPLGTRHPASRGPDVWFVGVRPVGAAMLPDGAIGNSGTWRTERIGAEERAARVSAAAQGDALSFRVTGDGFAVLFLHRADAGHVRLIVNNVPFDTDLFVPDTQSGLFEHVCLQGRWIARPTSL